jgi:DNA-binding CsgD family transcriptional regulator
MEALRQSERSTLLTFLRDCYAIHECESFEQFLRHQVTALAQLIPSNAVFYMEVDPDSNKSYHIGNQPYIEAPEAVAAWAEHGHEHPAAAHILKTGERSAVSVSEFWSQRQFQASGLHSVLYQPYSIHDDIALPVSSPLTVVGWHGDRRFTGRDRLMADLAGPHINQAWRNAKLVSKICQQLQLFKQGVESAGLGMISCDSDGGVQFNTSLARQYLVEYFGVAKNLNHHLPDELLRWMRHQNAQLLKSDVPPARRALTIQRKGRRLVVRLMSNSGANLLLLEEEVPPPNGDRLSLLGLSLRESEVLAWVAQGKTNGAIAAILGIDLGTVKKHLARVFEKLGVETRTAAAALALRTHSPSEEGSN